ncbi:MAG: threonylcarbamoyl-AMP synthase, partial [Burkholderiales bacterium]|nr:threonylcarbamoyl-AMP synthase [Burkholderiales bacterium]
MTTIRAPSTDAVALAVERLRAGELVGFPTETVYGLGADAANAQAVVKLFAIKGRPANHPVIVHLASTADIDRWARRIPPAARLLIEKFAPGPLTLILPKSVHVPDVVTGGQGKVGLRFPSHKLAQRLLREFGGGIAAPSANRFGRVSPTTARHVADEFGDELPLILDGGPCDVGIESTIIDFTRGAAVLLRPGGVSTTQLAEVLGYAPLPQTAKSPRVSGGLPSHYAPKTE